MRKVFILFIAIILMFSCNNDDSESSDPKTIDMVSGIFLKDGDGFLFGEIGNPNTNIDYVELSVYPNPATEILRIKDKFNNTITDVWFVKSQQNKGYANVDFSTLLDDTTYTIDAISNAADYNFNDLQGNNLSFNLEDFNEGYYKVFIKSNGKIHWDNIYVSTDGIQITELEEHWK